MIEFNMKFVEGSDKIAIKEMCKKMLAACTVMELAMIEHCEIQVKVTMDVELDPNEM